MNDRSAERSVRQQVYEMIRDDITFGPLMPGERLTEKKLSERYKASRSPIREALRQLESEGLIKFEANKGIEVVKFSPEELSEIYDLRQLLESYAVRLSVGKMQKKDIAHLEGLHKKMIKAAETRDSQLWLDTNALFHAFFREKADNQTLSVFILMLRRKTYRYQNLSVSIPEFYEEYVRHHRTIIDACKNNDVALAEKTMKIHLHKVREVLISLQAFNRNGII
jgi:DNA-binding GntR family transcriptional regulator